MSNRIKVLYYDESWQSFLAPNSTSIPTLNQAVFSTVRGSRLRGSGSGRKS